MTPLQQAEHLVRNRLGLKESYLYYPKPGEPPVKKHKDLDVHLEHYLMVLPMGFCITNAGTVHHCSDFEYGTLGYIHFNLTKGAPATEKDAEAFIKLVS